ncbi:hypothetical protein GCM10027203_49190 [Nonomuraea fastidiosa]
MVIMWSFCGVPSDRSREAITCLAAELRGERRLEEPVIRMGLRYARYAVSTLTTALFQIPAT